MRVNTRSKQLKDVKIDQRTQTIYKLTHEFIVKHRDPGASAIEISVRPDSDAKHKDLVVISYVDNTGETRRVSQRDIDPEIVQKMIKLRQLVRPSYGHQAPAPLRISTPGLLAGSLHEYLTGGHYRKFEKAHSAEFPHEEPKELLAKVVACEAMIYALFGQIHFRLDQAKEELEKTPPLPAERYKALKKDQEELEELLQKLRSIDREAIYETVASWNKLDTDPSKPNVLSKLKEATHQVSVKSKRSMQEHKIAHYAKQHWIRNSWFGNNPIGKWLGIYHYQPEEAAVHEYALDRGDLLLPDKEEEYARAKETDRIQKQSSVERFVVNLMISLLSPTKNKYTHLMDPGFECPVLAGISSPIKTAILHDLETSDDQHFSKAYAKKAYQEAVSALAHYTANTKEESIPSYLSSTLLKPLASKQT
ncbi:MAG: hypothetical protein A3C42_05740 [Chlamydiae bacterium RIFCSPHIGHO2_02_FULL_45_9]|nr:MAG: hypothetical protein A3C42_05740 [Chlamydiae bacterium RIFCSPHIGHO2_02_FULL_45_9]